MLSLFSIDAKHFEPLAILALAIAGMYLVYTHMQSARAVTNAATAAAAANSPASAYEAALIQQETLRALALQTSPATGPSPAYTSSLATTAPTTSGNSTGAHAPTNGI